MDAAVVRVEVPSDVAALQERDIAKARVWRERTRQAFKGAEQAGYRVAGFYRDASGRSLYVLVHSPFRS